MGVDWEVVPPDSTPDRIMEEASPSDLGEGGCQHHRRQGGRRSGQGDTGIWTRPVRAGKAVAIRDGNYT